MPFAALTLSQEHRHSARFSHVIPDCQRLAASARNTANTRLIRRLVFFFLTLFVLTSHSDAATLNVPAQYTTIQAAVNAAQSGDTVLIADGTYSGDGNRDIDFGGKNLTLTSQHGAARTMIDCGGTPSIPHRGFYLHSGETSAIVSGVTVENGLENGNVGAGISISRATVTIQNCTFKGNVITSYDSGGGGIYNDGGTIAVTNCVFTGNSAYHGAGIDNSAFFGGSLTVANCTFTGNSALSGGVLESAGLPGTTPKLTNVILWGDTGYEVYTGSLNDSSHCDIHGYAQPGNIIDSDPLFVSAPNDLNLQSGSPCLGTGTASGAPATTIDGQARPNPPSMGAYDAAVNGEAATTITVTANPSPYTVGQSAVFTATVTGNHGTPTGTVIFTIDGTTQVPVTLIGGSAGVTSSPLAVGSHSVTAVYNGDTIYAANTSSVFVHTVIPVSAPTVTLTSSLTPSQYAQAFHFSAAVYGYKPTGTVTFTDTTTGMTLGTGTLTNGFATFYFSSYAGPPSLPVGSHQIVASYSGDTNNNASSSAVFTQTVTIAPSTTSLNSNLNPSVFGQTVNFRAAVLATEGSGGTATGTMTFTVDGAVQATIPVSYGYIATYSTSSLPAGAHTITAFYSGDTNLTPSASLPLTQTVYPHLSPQYVSPSGNNSNPGTMALPKYSFQAAINVCQSGDTVIAEDGTYTGYGNVDLDFGGRSLTITSQNGPVKTIINCQGSLNVFHRAFYLHNKEISALISGLTIENGYEGADSGGGIYNSGADLTLQNCVLKNNSGSYGGGIYNPNYDSGSRGRLTLMNCTLTGNTALYFGGGIDNNSGALVLTGCTLIGNACPGGVGGGICNTSNALTLTGCTLNGNSASSGYGGGISNQNDIGGTATLIDCIFSGNSARFGGGLLNSSTGGALTMTNCMLTGNSSISGWGGGIANSVRGGTLTLTNCTLFGNSTTNALGGGIHNDADRTEATFLTNDILFGDAGGEVVGTNASVAYCDIQGGYAGTGNFDADPLFVSAPLNLRLQPGSPCLGMGTSAGAPPTDLDGNLRRDPPSIGAYEGDGSPLPTVPAAPTNLKATAGNAQVSLTWTASSGATSYNLYRSTTSGTETLLQSGLTANTYTDASVTNGTTYYYVVTAVNAVGESNSSNEASATPQAPPTTSAALRINCGGGAYTDTSGNAWQADANYSGGATWSFQGLNITGTSDPELYRDVRYGGVGSDFSYTLPAAPGAYTLKLHFVEGDGHTATPGFRSFNVLVNGTTALSNFDVFAAAGGLGKALDESLPVTAGANGVTVTFHTLTYGAMVSSIELVPSGAATAPAAPTSLVATAGNGQVSLSWEASSGATSYNFYRSTTRGGPYGPVSTAGTVAGKSFTDTSVTNGATYYYIITAVNTVGESTASNEASATPKAPATTPAAPTSLVATAGNGQVVLSWGASSGAASYNVKRATTSGGPYATVSTGGSVFGTSYTDKSLTNGTTYYYVVTAVNTVGESNSSNEASATPQAPPTTSAALRINCGGGAYTDTSGNAWQADANYSGGATWSFQGLNITGTSDPELYRDVRYGGVGSDFSYTLPAAPGAYTLKLHFVEGDGHTATPGFRSFNVLVNGTTALSNFDVFAAAGGLGKALDESLPVTAGANGVTVTFHTLTYGAMVSSIELVPSGAATAPAAPTSLVATAGNGQISLSWNGVVGANSYNVKRATTSGGPYTTVSTAGTVAGTSYTDTTVTSGTTYYYVVTAVNTVGEGPGSNEAAATPTAPAPPMAPTNLAATAGDGQVSLAWGASSGAASYNVKRATTSGGPYATVSTGGSVFGTSYTDKSLTNGTTYYYVVTAVNAVGESNSSNEASAAPKAPPATSAALRINCGGGAYTDTSGNAWQADANYSGGATWSFQGLNITGTSDPELYRDVRYGGVGSDFSYTLPAAPGAYTLKLHFVEGDGHTATPGFRSFNVLVNGTTALSNFDVFAAAGGLGKALDESLPVTAGANGVTVTFHTLTYGAMVSSIELVPAS